MIVLGVLGIDNQAGQPELKASRKAACALLTHAQGRTMRIGFGKQSQYIGGMAWRRQHDAVIGETGVSHVQFKRGAGRTSGQYK